MRRAKIEQQNEYLLIQQRRFRVAADVVTDAWMAFPEVHAVAVIGSVAMALWKEVPRFSDFRREGIEVWHECRDLDLALWIESQQRLREIHRAANRALSKAFTSGADTSAIRAERFGSYSIAAIFAGTPSLRRLKSMTR